MAHAQGSNIVHVFVNSDGDQIDLEMNTRYQVLNTIFIPYRASRNSISSPMRIDAGHFYHRVVPDSTIQEDPI